MLLWAPGGRGKTALVVRWIDQLPASLNRVFVPISIRAGTNVEHIFLEALAVRLALLLGETPPAIIDAHHTRERVQRFLASFTDPARPCVVVIDGLDEATGWAIGQSLLSHAVPAGLKILVSARQLLGDDGDSGWRDRLGWHDRKLTESLEILPLGRSGIADVLQRMGLAALSRDTVVVDRLFELTDDGEPLLVELYATDLRDPAFVERLHRLDPRTMIPGLRGFFSRWFADQETLWEQANPPIDKDGVYSMLAILACAAGALRIADLHAIGEHARLTVDATELKAVERFVVRFDRGVAVSDRSYVLTHPRLGDFLSHESELTEIYMPRVRAAFRAWGAAAVAAVNAPGGRPDQIPRYLLVYYLQHLASAPAEPLDSYRDLAENGWRMACTDYGGGEGSLAEQLETCFQYLLKASRANNAALKAPRTGLGGLIHIALCLASIRSLGTSIPPYVMAEMVGTGLLLPRRALFLSRFRRESDRAAIIGALAPILADADRPLLQIEARRLRGPQHRSAALVGLARHAPGRERMPLLSEALASASKEVNDAVRHTALTNCLTVAASFDVDEEDAAFNLAEQLFGKESLPFRQTRHSGAPEAPAAPEPMIRSIPARDFQTGFDPALFIRNFQRSLRTIPPELEPAHQRLSATQSTATTDDLRDILALIFVQEQYYFSNLITSVAPFLPKTLVSEALELTLENSTHWLGETLLPLAARLDENELLALFVRLLAEPLTVGTPTTIGKLLPLLPDAEITLLWPIIASLTPGFQKIRILREVAGRLDANQLDLIVDAVIAPDDPRDMASYYRADEIEELRPRFSPAQFARLVEQSFAPSDRPSRLLQAIAPELPDELLTQALSQTLGLPAGWARTETLKHLLPFVADRMPAGLEQVAAALLGHSGAAERLSLLEVALPHFSSDQRRTFLLDEQREAFKIGDRPTIALALACMDEFPDVADSKTFSDPSKGDPIGTMSLAFLALLPRIDANRAQEALQQVVDRLGELDASDRRVAAIVMALCPKLSGVRGAKSVQNALALLTDQTGAIDEERAALLFSPHLSDSDAQNIVSQALLSMQDASRSSRTRLILAVFLAEARPVSKKAALQAMEAIEAAFKEPAPPVTRALLLAALQLCRRVDLVDLPPLTIDELDLPPLDSEEERELTGQDLARFGVLPYLDGPALQARTLDLVERLALMQRQAALVSLSLVEGSWGDTIGLRPALNGGRPAQRVIERVGGPDAATETIAAIRAVAAWWP